MSDQAEAAVARRFEELKRLLAEYMSYAGDLPVKPIRADGLGPAFNKCLLEARFVFPGLNADEQEQLALVRLAGMNILARYLMTRLSAEELARCGLRVSDKQELDRVTTDLEADFVECKNQILHRGIAEQLTPVQKLFWDEWLNPFHGVRL